MNYETVPRGLKGGQKVTEASIPINQQEGEGPLFKHFCMK